MYLKQRPESPRILRVDGSLATYACYIEKYTRKIDQMFVFS